MDFVYLSPHLDDAALSCGGLIWDQVQAGKRVEVWNIFAGFPPEGEFSLFAQVHHKIWELSADEAIEARRKEDEDAMDILGVMARNLEFTDAIYRKDPKSGEPMYTTKDDLFGGAHLGDQAIVRRLSTIFAGELPKDAIVLCPLTVGNHVDHQLVRIAVGIAGILPWFYPEFPYTREFSAAIPALVPNNFLSRSVPISDQALAAWQESVSAYSSQISTFWNSLGEMKKEVAHHSERFGGISLFTPLGDRRLDGFLSSN